MTCIVGIASGGTVWIGGDSAGVSGLDLAVRSDPKVFINHGFVFGFTSSFRMGQLLAHAFKPPHRDPEKDLYGYMVTDFINAVRDCLKSGGYAENHSEAEKGGHFLVGHAGRLFSVESDYQVGENADGFNACGSGSQVALGSMFSTLGQASEHRVRRALEAAERFNAGVRGPFTVLSC